MDNMLVCTIMFQENYKKLSSGLTITYGTHKTDFGQCLIGVCDDGICHLSFHDDTKSSLMIMQTEWPSTQLVEDNARIKNIAENLFENKIKTQFNLFTIGTKFQNLVWSTLLKIPVGTTTNYENIASLIGKPTAVRAVSNAIAKNRIGYLIPCHRVISKTGKTHKYRWGSDRKKLILDYELNNRDQLLIDYCITAKNM